jgi:CYTH domain-containing protein
MTVKGDGTISRDEAEAPIPQWIFQLLWPRLSARIIKMRHSISYGDRTVEIDVFQAPLAPLLMAEVEFPSIDVARAFEPPPWLGKVREVTDDPRYKNKTLAVNGLPAEQPWRLNALSRRV